jgi:hypothetical protein
MTVINSQQGESPAGAFGGDGASLRLYASSNQDMISLNYETNASGLVEANEPFSGLGIYWINDLKAHLLGTEKENNCG